MATLMEQIEQKQERIQALRDELRTLEDELRAVRRCLKRDTRRSKEPDGVTRTRPIHAGASVWWALKILTTAGGPLHIDDLVRQMQEAGVSVKKTTLVSNLSRYVNAGDMFERARPSVYGLKGATRVQ